MNLAEPSNQPASELTDNEISKKTYYPDIRSTVKAFFVFIFYSFMVGLPFGVLSFILAIAHLKVPLLRSFLGLSIYIITLLVTIKYVIEKCRETNSYSITESFRKVQLWLVPVVIIGALALIIPLENTSSWVPMPKWVQNYLGTAFTTDVFSVIMLVIAAPIMEEIFCRGIILRGLLKNYSPFKAILISAIFFGAIHLNPWQGIPAFFNGLFLGWIYYKTQSVIPGIIIHATINGTATLFLFLPAHQRDLQGLFGIHHYIEAILVSIAIFVAICIVINRKVLIIRGSLFKTKDTYAFPNKESDN